MTFEMAPSKPQYTIEDGRVVYTHHYTGRQVLETADASTFMPLYDPVVTGSDKETWHFAGKDRAAVWFMHRRVDEADAASFRYFFGGQCHWGFDRSNVFAFYPEAKPGLKVAKSPVSETLRFLDEPFGGYMRRYALDDRRVYYHGRWVRGADPATFRNLPTEQPGESAASSDVYRDDRHAYYFGRKLEGIDPSALVIFRCPGLGHRTYAIDRENAYRVDATTRTRGRDVSGTPFTRLTHDEVSTLPQLDDVRAYLARRTDLFDYWFNRTTEHSL